MSSYKECEQCAIAFVRLKWQRYAANRPHIFFHSLLLFQVRGGISQTETIVSRSDFDCEKTQKKAAESNGGLMYVRIGTFRGLCFFVFFRCELDIESFYFASLTISFAVARSPELTSFSPSEYTKVLRSS